MSSASDSWKTPQDSLRRYHDHEVPGQDYHFISRTQFEADILNRKFEHP
ncbi:unnamed protein product [Leptidea sinapis]|uniref:Uncharacterized protein n=1 Tax=Leptidea sinapis TaxID=189913 RepID=A0A5E4Q5D8_9NEOP|nr:unnamed protein product [Leptidea sinapis]